MSSNYISFGGSPNYAKRAVVDICGVGRITMGAITPFTSWIPTMCVTESGTVESPKIGLTCRRTIANGKQPVQRVRTRMNASYPGDDSQDTVLTWWAIHNGRKRQIDCNECSKCHFGWRRLKASVGNGWTAHYSPHARTHINEKNSGRRNEACFPYALPSAESHLAPSASMKKKKHGRESEMEAARQQAINSHQNQKRWLGEPRTCVAIARPDCTDDRFPYGTTSQQDLLTISIHLDKSIFRRLQWWTKCFKDGILWNFCQGSIEYRHSKHHVGWYQQAKEETILLIPKWLQTIKMESSQNDGRIGMSGQWQLAGYWSCFMYPGCVQLCIVALPWTEGQWWVA